MDRLCWDFFSPHLSFKLHEKRVVSSFAMHVYDVSDVQRSCNYKMKICGKIICSLSSPKACYKGSKLVLLLLEERRCLILKLVYSKSGSSKLSHLYITWWSNFLPLPVSVHFAVRLSCKSQQQQKITSVNLPLIYCQFIQINDIKFLSGPICKSARVLLSPAIALMSDSIFRSLPSLISIIFDR